MSVEDEKAWAEYQQWRSDEGGYGRPGDEPSFMAGRASLRSRIAALEAVITSVGDALPRSLNTPLVRTLRALLVAPSTVLDQMIREAKAEAREGALEEAARIADAEVDIWATNNTHPRIAAESIAIAIRERRKGVA